LEELLELLDELTLELELELVLLLELDIELELLIDDELLDLELELFDDELTLLELLIEDDDPVPPGPGAPTALELLTAVPPLLQAASAICTNINDQASRLPNCTFMSTSMIYSQIC
jgi:hypothetical protein